MAMIRPCRRAARLVLVLLLLILLVVEVHGGGERGKKKKMKWQTETARKKPGGQRAALEQWASSLVEEKDYNVTQWRLNFRSRSPQDYFDQYVRQLSNLFESYGANVNFAMIGACDGTADLTIKWRFLPSDHWRAVFVEPMNMNVRDLRKFLDDNEVSNRSLVIQAAATSQCESPTIQVERPLYEEKSIETNKTTPHWLRRQIGSILPKGRAHARAEWTLEEVRCITATEILSEWALLGSTGDIIDKAAAVEKGDASSSSSGSSGSSGGKRKRRPHVLKIDVEGHDYDVLMGFVQESTPISELPLLIEFEAKSIGKKFPAAKEAMEKVGYVVSNFAADGFALLRGDRMLAQRGGGRKAAAAASA